MVPRPLQKLGGDSISVMSRGVHESGGSGLCPTRKPTRKRSGSKFLTRNRPVKRVRFRGSVFRRVASVSGEVETRRKTQKKQPKSAISRPIRPRSDEDFVKSDYFSPKSCRESLDLVYLCRIWLFWLPKSAKSSWKLVGINGEFARIDVFKWVGFHGFWMRELETNPPALGFGTRDPQPTVGGVGSGERRSGTGGLGGGLDSPSYVHTLWDEWQYSLALIWIWWRPSLIFKPGCWALWNVPYETRFPATTSCCIMCIISAICSFRRVIS